MFLLDLTIRQGGRYAYNCFDMDGASSAVFPVFTAPGAEIFVRLIFAIWRKMIKQNLTASHFRMQVRSNKE